jgi:hypothetical protein
VLRKLTSLFEPGELVVSFLVAIYILFGLELAAPPFWTMVEQGLDAEVRWPGVFILASIAFDLCGVYVLRRTLPPVRSDRPSGVKALAEMGMFVLLSSRWLVTLMLLAIGLLGLGIDVRGEPPLIVVALLLLAPALREVLVYRWLSRPAPVVSTDGTSHPGVALIGSLLLLPKHLVLITFIEEGLFADTLGEMDVVSEAQLSIAVVLSVCMLIATGVLYFILVYAPLRTPNLIRLVRQQKPLAWLPGFLLEVSCLTATLLFP